MIIIDEEQLNNIIRENISKILVNEDYKRYPKYGSPYDDTKDGNGVTQPLKNNISLYDIRPRIANILNALRSNRPDDAKKQALRLYKLVDALINQGYYIN